MNFFRCKNLLGIIGISLMLSGCVTGSTLRTARTLDKGEFELSGGVAGIGGGAVQTIIGAYGITNRVEIETRYEEDFFSVTPRFQITKSDNKIVDSLAFFELGVRDSGIQFGPGIMIGKRWNYCEPYLSWRFRYFTHVSQKDKNKLFEEFIDPANLCYLNYIKIGNRFHLYDQARKVPPKLKWFIGVELGPTFYTSQDVLLEWAVNIGFDY